MSASVTPPVRRQGMRILYDSIRISLMGDRWEVSFMDGDQAMYVQSVAHSFKEVPKDIDGSSVTIVGMQGDMILKTLYENGEPL